MKQLIIIGAVILIGALSIGLIAVSTNKPADQTPQQLTTPVPNDQNLTQPSIIVSLTAQNNSGEEGSATLVALEGGKTKVTLNLAGAPADIAQPAHIHSGSCANLGEVLYPLTSPVNGQSETTLNVALAEGILNRLPLSVNVHKSSSEVNIYYACGDIETAPLPSPSPTGSPNVTMSPTNAPTSTPLQTPGDRRRGADKPED